MAKKTSQRHFEKWLESMPDDLEPHLIPIKEGKNSDEGKAPDYLEIVKRGLRKYGLDWDDYRELKDEHKVVKTKHLAELSVEETQEDGTLKVSSWHSPYAKLSVKEARQRIAGGKNTAIVPKGRIAVMDIDNSKRGRKILPKQLLDTLTVESRTGKPHLYFRNGGVNNCDIRGTIELRAKGRYVLTPGSYVPPGNTEGDGLYKVSDQRELRMLTVDDLPTELQTRERRNNRYTERKIPDGYTPARLDEKVKVPCPFFDADKKDLSSVYLDFHNFAKSLILSRLQVVLENILAVDGNKEESTYRIRLMRGDVVLVNEEESIPVASIDVKTSKNHVKPVKAAILTLKKGVPSILAEIHTGDVHMMNEKCAEKIVEGAKKQLANLTKLEEADWKIPDPHACKMCSNKSCQYRKNNEIRQMGKELIEERTDHIDQCPSPIVDDIVKILEEILENEEYKILKLNSVDGGAGT